MGKNDLVRIGFPIDVAAKKCGIFAVKRRFALAKSQWLLKIENPTLNQVQSAAGSLRRVSQMRHWLRPFHAGLYAFSKTKRFRNSWQKIVDYDLKIWALFLKSPRFPAPISSLGNTPQIEIYTDACEWGPFEKGSINWE